MALFAGLFSLAGLSLWFARVLRRSSALMPLLAAAVAMLFFTLAGVAGLLQAGGYVWYAGCAAALGWVVLKEKKKLLKLFTPGLVFFLLGGIFFILLYLFTRPLLTQWDEFTFWGTAAKVTSTTGRLYTTATSSLIARSYPPGLVLFNYMMQFWGPFTEHGLIASTAIFVLPAFSAASALWGKNRSGAVVFLAGLALLPLFFETGGAAGQMMTAYLSCMVDMPMAVFFGGALCFYFASGDRGGRTLLPFAVILAALVNLKDMALALALIAWFVAMMDLLLCQRDRLSLFGLRRWKGFFAAAGLGLFCIVGSYLLWALHLNFGAGIDRFNLGSQGESLGQLEMLLAGFKALFGIQQTEQYRQVLPLMLEAFFRTPVFLLGSGAVLLGIILVLSVLVWVLSPTKRQRRRVLVYTLAMALCFLAFYIFNLFTYAFIFKPAEALILKDYQRYISPMWVAWLMGLLTLLSNAATNEKSIFIRLRVARGASLALMLAALLAVGLRGNWQANFLHISPALYGERWSVKAVAREAEAQGMRAGDVVYTITQWDDGTRFYILGLELPAVRVPLFAGPREKPNGEPELDEAGFPLYRENATATLAPAGQDEYIDYQVACTRQDLTRFLRQSECTHLLIDKLDDYIVQEFGTLFADELAGWLEDEDPLATGHRYYRIEWDAKGDCMFVPLLAEAEGGDAA